MDSNMITNNVHTTNTNNNVNLNTGGNNYNYSMNYNPKTVNTNIVNNKMMASQT
eukprot:CAMPEP_0170529748 /NCGR_PEP_ID=MMETSP0209-20121228/29855_1 /TAXON_ID=665100 ORGANISM="Litonotus pictus, Strain P1" /NCGR_SAMPLE_ID=MMETSP0209 /ASSEMBLY_ACC=CAM_ASM_000301 /LENGTH=53 /DNA_ID=CAMNT_0010822061 /DNA_START=1 /DNA_END=158 /DNA_ORIENTATION=-